MLEGELMPEGETAAARPSLLSRLSSWAGAG